jgi:hypothetical protein
MISQRDETPISARNVSKTFVTRSGEGGMESSFCLGIPRSHPWARKSESGTPLCAAGIPGDSKKGSGSDGD